MGFMSKRSAAAPRAPYRDQYGNNAALLIIDMINRFDFPGGDRLKEKALVAADAILDIRDQMEQHGWPIIYVNDNFGEWHSERSRLVQRALATNNPVAVKLKPRDHDYFIIKPQFSGFYATNLPVLLPKLGVRRLILTGVATDICVLFTAADAHMRDYALWIPADAVAAQSEDKDAWALSLMNESMNARTEPTDVLTLDRWRDSGL